MVKSLTISNSRIAAGRGDLHESPTSLLRNARPIGDVVEISPFAASASSGMTSWNTSRSPLLSMTWSGGAEAGPVGRNAVDVDQRDLRHPFLEHADARFDEALPLLRGRVLGVLAQIAQLARTLDLFGQLQLQLAVERVDLVLEFLNQSIFHRCRPWIGLMVPQCYASAPRMTAFRHIASRQNPVVARFRAAARGRRRRAVLLDGLALGGRGRAAGLRDRTWRSCAPTRRERGRSSASSPRGSADAGVEVARRPAAVMDALSPVRSPSRHRCAR